MGRIRAGLIGIAVLTGVLALVPATAGVAAPSKDAGNEVAEHWTAARLRAAEPRDLRVDPRGLGYLARKDGSVKPHGHKTEQLYARTQASKPVANAKPSGTDRTAPSVTARVPATGATVGATVAFSANVTDASGISSVTFTVRSPSGSTQSFTPAASGSTYSTSVGGFTNGTWSWRVVARDASGRANTTTTAYTTFTVNIGSGGGGNVANAAWTGGGTVQKAAGRIYFEMPTNSQLSSWAGYVCSGTVARDGVTGRSVIITAAHCVYDDAYKAFARNVLFIPNQAGTSGSGTDTDCSNDPMGCWIPSFGVVDINWTNRTFPSNIPWDYAYYVVNDTGAHAGTAAPSNVLDQATGDLEVKLTAPTSGAMTHALGYSYDQDPKFMYCAQGLATESSYGDWWLSQCGLSGGSSGGPWLQPVSGGAGPIISVNSWGYTNQPGMAGPKLSGTSASCVFEIAKIQPFDSVTNRGVATSCP